MTAQQQVHGGLGEEMRGREGEESVGGREEEKKEEEEEEEEREREREIDIGEGVDGPGHRERETERKETYETAEATAYTASP